MKRITCVVAAILLLVFVVRGVILPIVNHAGGGSNKDAETVNVQANTAGVSTDSSTKDGTASTDTAASDTDSADSGTDATVMPVKGSAAGERLSVMTPGWHEDSTGKWYQNPDGTYYVNGFADIDGTTYSFDKKGYMQTGWVEKGVKDYYFNEDGSYDPSKKRPMIALTFDDGPGEYTETLLDTVEKYNIHVTFFMLGQNVEGRESTIQRMVKLGCEIGNHTWDHPEQTLPNMDLDSVMQEFQKTDDALVKACGQASTVCRAPYGAITDEQMSAVGKPFFMWSTDSLDWKLMDADADYNQIMNDSSLGDGSIILMHDIHEPSVKCATEKLIPALIDQGYKLVTVSELAEARMLRYRVLPILTSGTALFRLVVLLDMQEIPAIQRIPLRMAPMEVILLTDLMSVTDLPMKGTIPMVLTKVIIRMDLPMMEAMMMVPTTNLMTMEAKNIKK